METKEPKTIEDVKTLLDEAVKDDEMSAEGKEFEEILTKVALMSLMYKVKSMDKRLNELESNVKECKHIKIGE